MASDLDLLDRVGRVGGLRERTALSIRIDDWVDFEEPVPLPGGGQWPEPGYRLHRADACRWWLLPGGRLIAVPEDPGSPVRETSLDDPEFDMAALAAGLMPAVIRRRLGGLGLEELEGPTVPAVVAELLSVAWRTEAGGREAIFRILAKAMRDEPGWLQSAARLKSAFERGLNDRSRSVRAVSARALVDMAAGRMPAPPTGDPRRLLAVMLHMPRADVKLDVLAALLELPAEHLEPLGDSLQPLLQEVMTQADAELRRLAGELQLRLRGGGGSWSLARDLASTDPERRRQALSKLELDADQLDLLLPSVLEALDDADEGVRGNALALLLPRLDAMPAELRQRVLETLLRGRDARSVAAAVEFLASRDEAERRALLPALRDALDGPSESREAVAGLWIEQHRGLEAAELSAGYRVLLHHEDPVLRQTILRRLVKAPSGRQTVRDALFMLLMERLRDREASLRIEAARAVVASDYPHADEIVGQLIFDRDRYVRRSALRLIQRVAKPERVAEMAELHQAVERLFALGDEGEADGQAAWTAALRKVLGHPSGRVVDLLAALLSNIPADTTDPFLSRAAEDLEAGLMRRVDSNAELLGLCRRLIEPPDPQPEHAVRIAATMAGEDPQAFDFLWTCFSGASGAASRAAERVLAGLASVERSDAVQAEIQRLLARTEDPDARRLLTRLARRYG